MPAHVLSRFGRVEERSCLVSCVLHGMVVPFILLARVGAVRLLHPIRILLESIFPIPSLRISVPNRLTIGSALFEFFHCLVNTAQLGNESVTGFHVELGQLILVLNCLLVVVCSYHHPLVSSVYRFRFSWP